MEFLIAMGGLHKDRPERLGWNGEQDQNVEETSPLTTGRPRREQQQYSIWPKANNSATIILNDYEMTLRMMNFSLSCHLFGCSLLSACCLRQKSDSSTLGNLIIFECWDIPLPEGKTGKVSDTQASLFHRHIVTLWIGQSVIGFQIHNLQIFCNCGHSPVARIWLQHNPSFCVQTK